MKIEAGLVEGQVLQRRRKNGASLQLLGCCSGAGQIRVTVRDKRGAVVRCRKEGRGKAARGRFTVSLIGIPEGGPYRLELRIGQEQLTVKSFFVGDVWLLAGQSNMEGLGDMTHPATPHPLVRSFSLAHRWAQARDPLHVLRESPDACHHQGQPFTSKEAAHHRRTTDKGVGVGIFFARERLHRTGVPQGLICAAHGGTRMSQWCPDAKGRPGDSLYASMLHSVRATGQSLAGVLWYQGESDANGAEKIHYTARMKKLVSALRRDLRQPSLLWLVAQISRVTQTESRAEDWNDIQEQQRLLPERIDQLEIVSTIDLPLDDRIHISARGFPRLGARLATAADLPRKRARPPRLREIVMNPPEKTEAGASLSIDVVFDNIAGALRSAGEPSGFTLVTGDGTVWPHCYKTTLLGHKVRLHLAKAPTDDIRLHHGHGLAPVCTITDARDMALPVFGPHAIT